MLNRRGFMASTLGVGATLAMRGPRNAVAQANRRMIVDAQVHLWKADTPDWKWVPGRQPQLPEPFTIERLVPMMEEAGVDRAVIIPPSWPGDRNDYALEAVKRYPARFRVMGRIPLQDPKSADLLPTWKEQQGMLGVRALFGDAQSVAWLKDGTTNWFWAAAEKADIPVMFFAPGNTSLFGPIAERHPQLTLILDHMGATPVMARENKVGETIGQAVALAKYPNVSVKLSGSLGLSSEPYPFRDVATHLKRVFDAFGPQRCYWGTDMTASFAKASYRQRVAHFTEELDFLNEADKDWVMGRAIVQRLKWT